MTVNRFSFTYDSHAINRDFIVISLKRTGNGKNWHGTGTLLQSLGEDFKALSVFYDFSGSAYLLFSRSTIPDPQMLRSRLAGDLRLEDAQVKILSVIDPVPPKGVYPDNTFSGYWVVSLLMNAIPALMKLHTTGTVGTIKTLNGKLFLFPAKLASTQTVIKPWECRFGKDGTLSVHERSFTKISDKRMAYLIDKNPSGRPAVWQIDSSTGSLARVHGTPEKAYSSGIPLYEKRKIHGSVFVDSPSPFFDLKSPARYNACRVGVYQSVSVLIKDCLSSWVVLKKIEIGPEIFILSNQPIKWKKRIQEYLPKIATSPLRIIDTIGNEQSRTAAEAIRAKVFEFVPAVGMPVSAPSAVSGACNLVLLHESSWYKEPGRPSDPHIGGFGYLCQHQTLEKFEERQSKREARKKIQRNDPVIAVCLKELCLKNDIIQKSADFTEWIKYGYSDQFTFCRLSPYTPKRQQLDCTLLTIQPDGSMDFKHHHNTTLNAVPEEIMTLHNLVNDFIQQVKSSHDYCNYRFEGLVRNGNGDINVIFRSEAITLPDNSQIEYERDRIFGRLPSFLGNPHTFSAWLEKIYSDSMVDQQWNETLVQGLLADFKNHDGVLDRNAILGVFKNRKIRNQRERTYFTQCLARDFGVSLQMSRSKENKRLLLDFKMNLQYQYVSPSELWYAVGYPNAVGLRESFSKASHLRHVLALPGHKLFFEELFPTFDDNSIRLDENTVLPLPFKYLREYALMANGGESEEKGDDEEA